MGTWLLLGLVGGLTGGAGPLSPAGEAPLPAGVGAEWREWEPGFQLGLLERPDRDLLWPVAWLTLLAGDSDAVPDGAMDRPDLARRLDPFWQELAPDPPSVRSSSRALETREDGLPSVTELGLARMREIEAEPRFFPMVSRILLGGPAMAIEGLSYLLLPRVLVVNGQQVLNQDAAHEDLATIFARTLVLREINFLAGVNGSYLNTVNAQLGTEDVDQHNFHRLQSRVFFDSMKRAYRERYQIPSLDIDTLVNTLSTGDWFDFVVIPAVVSAYAARYGVDRKIKITEDVKIQLQVEKGTRFYKVLTEQHGGRLVTASVNFFKLPVSAVVSLDAAPQGVGFGFIGIGTDIDVVLGAITGRKGPHELR